MNKFVWIFLLLVLFGESLYAVSDSRDSILKKNMFFSSRYLSYSCFSQRDSVLKFCLEAKKWAANREDNVVKFCVEQLVVNVLCLKGDIGTGISVANDMYKEAKDLDYLLGKALALQAIGATYMHAGQYAQALSTFAEAEPLIYAKGDSLMKINLAVQQLSTCTHLGESLGMVHYLSRVSQLVNYISPELKNPYLLYVACYDIMLQIVRKQTDDMGQKLQKLEDMMLEDVAFKGLQYYVQSSFYNLMEDYPSALSYLDSTLLMIGVEGVSTNEYKDLTYRKAILLEKTEDYAGACLMYSFADSLTNVLNVQGYVRQLENLHMRYYVDKTLIENVKTHNKWLTCILLLSLVCMAVVLILVIMAVKRNRELKLSHEKLNQIREDTADLIQSKSMFLSNMSHDLRTPLNGIVGFTDLLVTMDDIDSELKEQCRDNIQQNSELLMKLINDIIDFSSLKSGEIRFDLGEYDTVSLCRNVIQTVASVKKTDAELLFETKVEKLVIETDSGRLLQVLINLLVNATKFTKEGYIRLILDFDPNANEAIFTIEDTGCGIPLEKQARIFERFEKLHEAAQGVGLGLSICKLIVQHVNGRIWIDSTYTEGARFIFTHPVVRTDRADVI